MPLNTRQHFLWKPRRIFPPTTSPNEDSPLLPVIEMTIEADNDTETSNTKAFTRSTHGNRTLGKSAACEETVPAATARTVLYSARFRCPGDCHSRDRSTNGVQHTGLDSRTKQPLWFEIFKPAPEYASTSLHTGCWWFSAGDASRFYYRWLI